MWPRTVIPALLALVLAAGATTGPSTRPATLPTTVPATLPTLLPTTGPVAIDPAIQRAFERLADADPAARDAAQEWLMGLPTDALPKLLAVVRATDPLLPAQAASLHEVVSQVFLAGERYAPATDADDPAHEQLRFVIGLRGPDLSFAPDSGPPLGIPVVDRWPGFPARRLLRDGDLILGIYIEKQLPLERLPNRPTYEFKTLRLAILAHPDVRDIDLSILRDGRQARVSVTLAPQAQDAIRPELRAGESFLEGRRERAEKYWRDNFAAVVGSAAGPEADGDFSLDR